MPAGGNAKQDPNIFQFILGGICMQYAFTVNWDERFEKVNRLIHSLLPKWKTSKKKSLQKFGGFVAFSPTSHSSVQHRKNTFLHINSVEQSVQIYDTSPELLQFFGFFIPPSH